MACDWGSEFNDILSGRSFHFDSKCHRCQRGNRKTRKKKFKQCKIIEEWYSQTIECLNKLFKEGKR